MSSSWSWSLVEQKQARNSNKLTNQQTNKPTGRSVVSLRPPNYRAANGKFVILIRSARRLPHDVTFQSCARIPFHLLSSVCCVFAALVVASALARNGTRDGSLNGNRNGNSSINGNRRPRVGKKVCSPSGNSILYTPIELLISTT